MRAVVVLSVVLLSACRFGGGAFLGDLDGQLFDPIGTVFTYVDERDEDLAVRDAPRLVTVATWVIFDPNRDLNETDGALLEDIQHEVTLRDNLALVFTNPEDVVTGANFESVSRGGNELGDGEMLARVYLQPELLNRASTFDGFRPFASERTFAATITFVDLAGAGLELDAGLNLARAEADPDDAREGTVSGELFAPVVDEQLAEHNLALLGLDTLLGLP